MEFVRTNYATWEKPLKLESGVSLAPITLAYEVYGELNEARDNAILVLHALSGDAHAAGRHNASDRYPGWWDALIGPGKPLDTDRFCIICSNVLGGCKGSTGPSSTNPATGQPYGARFPVVTIGDMVEAQARLLDRLEIQCLLAVVGGSMGGYQALEWAVRYPERVRGVIPLATSSRSTAQTLAWSAIGRRAIMSDSNWRGGDYYGGPAPIHGLAVARMIGHITYLSSESLDRKFGRGLQASDSFSYQLEPEFAIESYLDYQGASFNARFDANSYLYILKAIDYWDLGAAYGTLDQAVARSKARWQIFSFISDWLYPVSESELIAESLERQAKQFEHIVVDSTLGHDAFLLEEEKVGEAMGRFLNELHASPASR